MERLSSKYVKSCGSLKNYFTFDATQEPVITWEMDDSDAGEFKRSDKSAAGQCPMSTLVMAKPNNHSPNLIYFGICFYKRVSVSFRV